MRGQQKWVCSAVGGFTVTSLLGGWGDVKTICNTLSGHWGSVTAGGLSVSNLKSSEVSMGQILFDGFID